MSHRPRVSRERSAWWRHPGLRRGAIDLAVIGVASAPGRGIERKVINDDVMVAAVAQHSERARRIGMSVRALAEHELICLPRGAGIRASLDEGCAAVGVQARVSLEASNPEVIADLAARGLRVAGYRIHTRAHVRTCA